MGYARAITWAMRGLCVGYAWVMHGLCMGYALVHLRPERKCEPPRRNGELCSSRSIYSFAVDEVAKVGVHQADKYARVVAEQLTAAQRSAMQGFIAHLCRWVGLVHGSVECDRGWSVGAFVDRLCASVGEADVSICELWAQYHGVSWAHLWVNWSVLVGGTWWLGWACLWAGGEAFEQMVWWVGRYLEGGVAADPLHSPQQVRC
jgi:hypothetical protein